MTRIHPGKNIIPLGVFPERHELETAAVFLALGYDVEFLAPSRTPGSRTPDVMIANILWEMKAPQGKTQKTLANALRRAVKQSGNVIIDARRMKLSDEQIIKELKRNVALTRSLKKLKLILKPNKIIDIL